MATAGGRLYLCTVDGRVLSLANFSTLDSSTRTKDAARGTSGSPWQTLWEKPEDASYLLPLPQPNDLPLPQPNDAGFNKVSGCKIFASELGYRLRADARNTVGLALKTLDKPITGSVTFRTRIRAVPDAEGLLRNGYLAFGGSAEEAELVKCGVRLQAQTAAIVQGPLKGGKSTTQSSKLDASGSQGVEAVVTVDLAAQRVTFMANGAKLESPLQRSLSAITHLGYAVDSAMIDVAPIEVQRP
jgi:hypothetical protein